MNRNLINGQPLEFGNWQQIKIIRKAAELYSGLKPVALVQDEFDEEPPVWGEESDELVDVFQYQFLCFGCILPNCMHSIYERAFTNSGYFINNHTFHCDGCGAEYQIRDCECFHLPNKY